MDFQWSFSGQLPDSRTLTVRVVSPGESARHHLPLFTRHTECSPDIIFFLFQPVQPVLHAVVAAEWCRDQSYITVRFDKRETVSLVDVFGSTAYVIAVCMQYRMSVICQCFNAVLCICRVSVDGRRQPTDRTIVELGHVCWFQLQKKARSVLSLFVLDILFSPLLVLFSVFALLSLCSRRPFLWSLFSKIGADRSSREMKCAIGSHTVVLCRV